MSLDETAPTGTPGSTVGREPPPEVAKAPPGERFGRYVRLAKLGAGGMGEVWKAWDCELARPVALKFLKPGRQEEADRFLREARIAARLDHPNIAAVYDAGEANGQPFIAMQLVEGTTLRAFVRRERVAVELVRDAARAVDFAHKQGVIHRDLKPENVMVDGASRRVFVMDFGLAKSVDAGASLSATGFVVGTPSYMPAEQARGEHVDGRADVYALGATLYELLSGRVPFDGSNIVEILMRVATEESKPLPGELGAVVAKAMMKEPDERYATPGALADDLDRWLRGEPVSAKPLGWVRRVRRGLSRHKLLASIVAGALLALGGSMALIPLLRSTESAVAREQAAALERVRRTAKTCTEGVLELRRGGAVRGLERLVGPFEEAFAKAVAGRAATAEVYYLRGRLMRALMRDEEALAMQNEALARDAAFAPSLYERAILNSYRYAASRSVAMTEWRRREGSRIKADPNVPVAPSEVEDIERLQPTLAGLRESIFADIRRLAELRDPRVGEAHVLAGLGLLNVLSGNHDAGMKQLEAAAQKDPTLEEVFAALGEFSDVTADRIEWFTKGLSQDRGYLPHLLGRASALELRGTWVQLSGEDPAPWYERAIADDDAVLEAVPNHVPALCHRARTRAAAAVYLGSHGGDAVASYEAALKDVDRALKGSPGDALVHLEKASTLANYGAHLGDRGRPSREVLEAAERECNEVLRLDPLLSAAWSKRGSVRSNLALLLDAESADEVRAKAESDMKRGLELDPTDRDAWCAIANLHHSQAAQAAERNRPSEELFVRAIDEYERALKLNPKDTLAQIGRASTRLSQGNREMREGRDPGDHFAAAEAEFKLIMANAPRNLQLLDAWAGLDLNWGLYEFWHGGSPMDRYRAALEHTDEALKIDPGMTRMIASKGLLLFNIGLWEKSRGVDPSRSFEQAEEVFTGLIARDPASWEYLLHRGKIRNVLGMWRRGRGLPGGEEKLRKALDDYDQGIVMDPRILDGWHGRADAEFNLAIVARGEERDELYRRAIRDYTKALEGPATVRAERHLGRGLCWAFLGNAKKASGEDPTGEYEKALADYTKALELEPGNTGARFRRATTLSSWAAVGGPKAIERFEASIVEFDELLKRTPANAEGWMRRGMAHWNLGRGGPEQDRRQHYECAVRDYEKALELDPEGCAVIRGNLEAARQILKEK